MYKKREILVGLSYNKYIRVSKTYIIMIILAFSYWKCTKISLISRLE